jgi:hypothetical protein
MRRESVYSKKGGQRKEKKAEKRRSHPRDSGKGVARRDRMMASDDGREFGAQRKYTRYE